MKITFLLPVLGWSGGIRVAAIHAKWLAEHGHEVTLVSQAAPRPSWRKHVWHLMLGKEWLRYQPVPPSHFDSLGLKHIVVPAGQLPEPDQVPPADVLVSTWWETAEWSSRLPADRGARVYFIQHHEVFDYLPINRCEATYRLPFHKVVIAKWLSDLMADKYSDKSVDLVPNAVDRSHFHAPPRGRQAQPTIGILLNETPFKGLDVALAALSRLEGRYPDLRVIAFGPDSPSGRWALPKNLELHICPEQSSLRTLYARCDLWLTTSYSEGFNLMAMEAMACRTPVVSTRTGWPVEGILDGVNGYLVNVGDSAAAAAAAGQILDLAEVDWVSMSNASYATVANTSWDTSSQLFERALYRACERAKRGEVAGVPAHA